MGLFGFLKKKESVQQPSAPQQFDINNLPTDIPSVDGSSPQFAPLPKPTFGELPQYGQPSQSFNLDQKSPNELDPQDQQYSLPPYPGQNNPQPSSFQMDIPPLEFPQQNMLFGPAPQPSLSNEPSMQEMNMPQRPRDMNSQLNQPAEVEESLNRLFVSDSKWKEPDWNTFEPYTEDQIEEPSLTDFGVPLPKELEAPSAPYTLADDDSQPSKVYAQKYQQTPMPKVSENQFFNTSIQVQQEKSDLPEFDEDMNDSQSDDQDTDPESIKSDATMQKQPSYDKSQQNTEPVKKRISKYQPMDLFVKGSDYESVVHEFQKINQMLTVPEPGINITEDIIKKQEPDLTRSKENMEYIYKKLVYIDNKVFKA